MKSARIKSVNPIRNFVVLLEFTDGTKRKVNLAPFLRGKVFKPLRNDEAMFRAVKVDERIGALVWENGTDIDPDVLYHNLQPAWAEEKETKRGELAPSREFVIEKNLKNVSSGDKGYAICVSNEDEELIPLKIYSVVLHPHLQTCTVKDENDETVVCPLDWFLPVEFPKNIEQALEKVELALA